ncbi:hypothetical protein LINPERHAP1_LOCUS6414 [Linum perenne]
MWMRRWFYWGGLERSRSIRGGTQSGTIHKESTQLRSLLM